MADLYRFMRKILEKYSWDLHLAQKMLSAYDSVRPLSESEWQNLRVRFCYPEKYWKLANHYYTHNKAVISGKNVGKAKNLDPSEKTVGGIFKTVLQTVMILNVTKTKLPFFLKIVI